MEKIPPHVLIFPIPALGHVNSMLKLAELLSVAGINVTFLNSEYNHSRLVRHTDICSRYTQRFPGFQFKTVTDGLPMDHPRTGDRFEDVLYSVKSVTPPLLKDMLLNEIKPPVNCIISDGFMSFAIDVARDLGIPIIYFRTIGACALWAYYSLREVIDAGELPIKGAEDMDRLIKNVPGMESYLRCRDLPSFCRASDPMDKNFQLFMGETRSSPRADGLILNTFEDLEGPILSQIRTICPNIYTIGPLNAHLKATVPESTSLKSSNSFWEVDRSCISWLDKQPPQSVIYVSFGSIAVLSREQLLEFWHGLVNSNKRFLWVIRPDSISGKNGEDEIPEELVGATKERGYMVGWVPQEEVLAHQAVALFLTHSGWNSTLESIVAGVPMLCWPYFADQQVNSRFVGEVWKIGVYMKDLCDRNVVEKMVNELTVERKEEFMKASSEIADLARKSVNEGGSSYCNLDRLINDIESMSSRVFSC
ncbi:7-deoxyloganetic acid glucosyl transferase-like [Mangifera indica]|uniref:7-deoxyloganetic acid glucosyl transferase-like n=1 Tax=Mangifera indica TaxID=29780 RepID=UPI001CFA7C3F|nr:7-deoxyloganetic acid glucosyl transferase-like [Mangifera indica]